MTIHREGLGGLPACGVLAHLPVVSKNPALITCKNPRCAVPVIDASSTENEDWLRALRKKEECK